jgi:predicted thioesterase
VRVDEFQRGEKKMNNYKTLLETERNPLIGKTVSVTTTVSETNTAKTVGSGSLDVFATPMMIALMEKAACECLADSLADGQTSVGTQIAVEHTAASTMGSEITATAVVEHVSGRKVEFAVSASDGSSEIGKGKHTRFIVDTERFMTKANE